MIHQSKNKAISFWTAARQRSKDQVCWIWSARGTKLNGTLCGGAQEVSCLIDSTGRSNGRQDSPELEQSTIDWHEKRLTSKVATSAHIGESVINAVPVVRPDYKFRLYVDRKQGDRKC